MELKRNLVKELREEKFREEYLHPKKRSIFEFYKLLSKDLKTNKKIPFYYLIFGLSKGFLPIISAFIVAVITQFISTVKLGNVDTNKITEIVVIIVGYGFLYFLLNSIGIYVFNTVRVFIFGLRNERLLELFGKMATMEFGLCEDASFMSSLGNWGRAIQSNATGYQGILENSLSLTGEMCAGILLGMLFITLDFRVTLIAIISVFLNVYLEEKYTFYQKSLMEEDNLISKKIQRFGNINSDFQYGKDVRVFRMESVLQKQMANLIRMKNKYLEKYFFKRIKQAPFIAISSMATFISGVYYIGLNYSNGNLPMDNMVIMLTALLLFVNVISSISTKISFIKNETIYLDDFYDLLESKLEPIGGNKFPKDIKYDIRFENVSFKYPGSENYVLRHTSFYVPKGQSIALVGVNGAGKTSIIKLLMGLYQPDEGRILIGGVDISTISQEEIAKIFGVVFQDVNPVAMSVRENVSVSYEDNDRERVKEVLKRVGMLEKIESFENGIDSHLLRVIDDDGIVLSGGENQKIMIARALYKKTAEILVLDEPTAALDALAEEEIYKEFHNILMNRTAIFISHRLASTRFCDKIVLLNSGKVTEEGTHEELLAMKGLYYKMYETQASYYKEEKSE